LIFNPLFEDSLMASQTLWLASPSHKPGITGVLLIILWAHKFWILKTGAILPSVHVFSKLKFEDLINSANGSPNQLLKNIEIWNDFSDEILSKLDYPIKNSLEILEISKSISERLEILQQICLVNLIQTIWWRKTKN